MAGRSTIDNGSRNQRSTSGQTWVCAGLLTSISTWPKLSNPWATPRVTKRLSSLPICSNSLRQAQTGSWKSPCPAHGQHWHADFGQTGPPVAVLLAETPEQAEPAHAFYGQANRLVFRPALEA